MTTAIAFAQFGPYHHARVRALQAMSAERILPVQIASGTNLYAWDDQCPKCENLQTLFRGEKEEVKPLAVYSEARKLIDREGIDCFLLPSYAPKQETALYLAAWRSGARCIMMNESHALTEQARGIKRSLKKLLLRGFDAALVGGAPQKRHFTNLGLSADKIFTGYDAIDNETFRVGAMQARKTPEIWRKRLQLPNRYFLNLGRMIEKKNLSTLLTAYAEFCQQSTEPVALCLVGSGDKEAELKKQAADLGLSVHDYSVENSTSANNLGQGDVAFFGFRQISENPCFYGLAEAFILPSTWEEWGLVVNEAMASGLPVLVAEGVGSAEDLVDMGRNGYTFQAGDTNALAQRLFELAGKEDLRNKMGRASAEIIAEWDVDNFASNALRAIEAAKL